MGWWTRRPVLMYTSCVVCVCMYVCVRVCVCVCCECAYCACKGCVYVLLVAPTPSSAITLLQFLHTSPCCREDIMMRSLLSLSVRDSVRRRCGNDARGGL